MAPDIPETSLAAIQPLDSQTITVTTRPTPKPTGSQVLVRVHAAGICATDLHLSRRNLPYLQPKVTIGGHEGAGVIAALGPEVNANTNGQDGDGVEHWQVGDRVAVRWVHLICGTCELCTTGHENLCQGRKLAGKDVEGCFAEYTLADTRHMVRLPDGMSDMDAAPILCAGVTVYKALKTANLRKGSWVAVAGGGGGLGHLAIQYARAMGYKVVAIDANKRDLCMSLGANAYVDVLNPSSSSSSTSTNINNLPTNESDTTSKQVTVPEAVISITDNLGPHAALLCASSGQAYADAVRFLRRTGTLVCIGLPHKPTPIPVLPEDFVARGIRIVGASTGDRGDTLEALGFVARGEVKARILERALGDVGQTLEEIERGTLMGKAVVRMI